MNTETTPIYDALVARAEEKAAIAEVKEAWGNFLAEIPEVTQFDIPAEEWPNVHSTILRFVGETVLATSEYMFEHLETREYNTWNSGALAVAELLRIMVPQKIDESAQ